MCDYNKKVLKLAGKNLIKYCKNYKLKLNTSNTFNTTIKGRLLDEISYKTSTRTVVYSTLYLIKQQNCANTETQLNYGDDVPSIFVIKTFLTMDMVIFAYSQFELKDFPLYKNFSYNENPNIFMNFQKLQETNSGADGRYQEIEVYRNTTYVFYPYSTMYFLVCPDPQKIYVLQTYTNEINNTLNLSNLILINDFLKDLPSGWIFTCYILGNKYFTAPSNGCAFVITDNMNNFYQLIPYSKDSSEIYKEVFNTV
jgi:hypothetical protein